MILCLFEFIIGVTSVGNLPPLVSAHTNIEREQKITK